MEKLIPNPANLDEVYCRYMTENKLIKRRIELLEQISSLAKACGVVAIKDTALLNARNYAQEQIRYGFSKDRAQEELEIEGLERHLNFLKGQTES